MQTPKKNRIECISIEFYHRVNIERFMKYRPSDAKTLKNIPKNGIGKGKIDLKTIIPGCVLVSENQFKCGIDKVIKQ